MGEACTQLEVNIISAQDLKKINIFGRMQTYGVAWIESGKKLKTQIDRTGGANPTWNDKLIFRVEERFLRSVTSALTVEIYCVGCLKDKLLGTARVLISNLLKGYGSEGSEDFSGMSFSPVQVRRPSSRPQGILNLGTVILGGMDLIRMNRFNPSSRGCVGYRDLMGISVDKKKQQNGGDEIFEKKAVGCYHILMAPKLKTNKVGLRNKQAAVHPYYYYY